MSEDRRGDAGKEEDVLLYGDSIVGIKDHWRMCRAHSPLDCGKGSRVKEFLIFFLIQLQCIEN